MTSNGPDSPIGDKGASVRRHNTVGGSAAGRLRQLVEQRAHASPSSPPNESTTPSALSESPLYAHLDQKLHRHASLPSARGGAESWSARRARAQTGPQRLAEDGETGEDDSPRAEAPERHHRTVSVVESTTSSSASTSPTSTRADEPLGSAAAGVRRHQSLNLHRHRQQASTDRFSPLGGGLAGERHGRRPSDGDLHLPSSLRQPQSPLRSPVETKAPFGSRGPWSPTREEVMAWNAKTPEPSQTSPTRTSYTLEDKFAGLDVEENTGTFTRTEDLPGPWAAASTPPPKLQPPMPNRRNGPALPPLVTNFGSPGQKAGPASASASVPWIGQHHASVPRDPTHVSPIARKGFTAAPGPQADVWSSQKDLLMGGVPARTSSMHPHPGYLQNNPHAQAAAFLQQQQAQLQHLQQAMRNGAASPAYGLPPPPPPQPPSWSMYHPGPPSAGPGYGPPAPTQPTQQAGMSPVDVVAFAQSKGFNPPPHLVDLQPPNARFFVIKSYTEEDVHKSIKYSIWTSTALGNKRLDKAFRENAELGKIFLFFSVNSSGHFCGVAEMLTHVDESLDATVWAQSKWKGVFKVRWLYIRDVPNQALRHIRLANTPEAKPVTSSRDTQEVPYEAGCDILRIFSSYNSKTSLLQDYQWYENREAQQQMQAVLIGATPASHGPLQPGATIATSSSPAPMPNGR